MEWRFDFQCGSRVLKKVLWTNLYVYVSGEIKKYYLFTQHLKREIVKCSEKNAMEPYPQGVLGCYRVHDHSRHLSFVVVFEGVIQKDPYIMTRTKFRHTHQYQEVDSASYQIFGYWDRKFVFKAIYLVLTLSCLRSHDHTFSRMIFMEALQVFDKRSPSST